MAITFLPEAIGQHLENNTVTFEADVDGERVVNRIAIEALRSSYGRDDAIVTFIANRAAIEDIARRKIENGQTNANGGADVFPRDME